MNANITTALPGTIHLLSANNTAAGLSNGVIMSAPSIVEATNSSVRIVAQNGGSILLSRVNALNVSLNAAQDILDNNGNVLNVQANVLRAVASNGTIGSAEPGSPAPDLNGNAIDTQVTILAASAVTGIYIQEADGVTVDNTGQVVVRNVFFNSTESNVTDASIEDLRTTINGPIKLQSVTGDITINTGLLGNPGISANGTGDVLLQTLAADGDIVVNAEVISGTGDISVRAGDDLFVSANITTALPGTIHLLAANGTAAGLSNGVIISAPTTVEATNSSVRIAAQNGGDILLSRVNASSVSLNASNSIIDNNDTLGANTLNIRANSLQMVATNGLIGNSDVGNAIDNNTAAIDTQVTTLAAQAVLGIYVREVDGVTVDRVTTTISNVFLNSTEAPVTDTLEDLSTTNNGPIKLQSVTGNIVVNPGTDSSVAISANGTGDVLLQTLAADGDIFVNARIASGTGDINLQAGDNITIESDLAPLSLQPIIQTSGAGTIYLLANNGTDEAIDGVTMTSRTVVQADGDIRIVAGGLNGDIRLARIISNSDVSLQAANSIIDNNDGVTPNTLNVQATSLQMIATNGLIGNSDVGNALDSNTPAIDISVDRLATRSGSSVYVREVNEVTIGDVTATVNAVHFRSTEAQVTDVLEDMVTVDGHIKLQAVAGNIVVDRGATGTSGIEARGINDVLLQTIANNGDIIVNAQVISQSRDISLRAGDDVVLNAELLPVGLPILANGVTGTIFVQAANRTVDGVSGVEMTPNALITSGYDVRVEAQNGGNILLGRIEARRVSLFADESILDGNDALAPNTLNVQALQLQMVATNGLIGDGNVLNAPDNNSNAIDTRVGIFAARASDGVYVRELDGLTIDTVVSDYYRTNFNSLFDFNFATLEDVTTTNNGPIKLQSVTGDIVVNTGLLGNTGVSANGTGDVLLQTLAADGDIVVNAEVVSGTGDISVRAGDDLFVNANITTALPGTIHLLAANSTAAGLSNGVTMSAPTTVEATNSSVRIVAQNGGDILLSRVIGSSVSLNASNSIIDNNDAVTPNTLNVQANSLQMAATSGRIGNSDTGNAIDNNTPAIDTQVINLAARSALGIYVRELDGVTVGSVSMTVSDVFFNSTEAPLVDTSEDLTTTNGGPIKLQSVAGNITINAGLGGNPAVSANGAGDVLLQTLANDGDIILNGSVTSGSGNINVRGGDDIDVNSLITTGGNGSIYLFAGSGTNDAVVPEVDGINVDGSIQSASGDILLLSNRDVRTTATITSTTGDVGIVANRDSLLNSTITTGGNVLVSAANAIEMSASAAVNGGTNALLNAVAGRINLGLVSAVNVGIDAAGSILDNNATATNVRSTNLRITSGQSIGQADLPNLPANNANAIDLEVSNVAALSADGIYLEEVIAGGNLTVGQVGPIQVAVAATESHFNSTSNAANSSRNVAALSDLVTTASGPIKVQVAQGRLVITDGDASGFGVSAAGASDILLQTLASDGDIEVNSQVRSGTGDISLRSNDDVFANAAITTSGSGTVYLRAGNGFNDALPAINGIDVQASITSGTGDLLVDSAQDIRLAGSLNTTGMLDSLPGVMCLFRPVWQLRGMS